MFLITIMNKKNRRARTKISGERVRDIMDMAVGTMYAVAKGLKESKELKPGIDEKDIIRNIYTAALKMLEQDQKEKESEGGYHE